MQCAYCTFSKLYNIDFSRIYFIISTKANIILILILGYLKKVIILVALHLRIKIKIKNYCFYLKKKIQCSIECSIEPLALL